MTQEKDNTGFLSRWSQRKLSAPEEAETVQVEADAQPVELPVESPDVESTTDEDKPIWQRDDVDDETKKAALRSLFHKPEFHVRDGLNEYDDDFTKFASLGNIVTHEMKRMIKLAEEKTRPDSPVQNLTDTAAADSEPPTNDNEDNDLA